MISNELLEKGKKAKEASRILSRTSSEKKNKALAEMAKALMRHKEAIIAANTEDMQEAKAQGMNKALLDRLLLTEARIEDMALGLEKLISLDDPIGHISEMWLSEDGLQIGKMAVPLGVIGIIYEARPNVAADAAGLCLKSGNAVLLRGGSDAKHSNRMIVDILSKSLESAGLPPAAIQGLEDTSRETATQMMRLNQYLDVLIPRGGEQLIQTVVNNATVPVIETGIGNCHVYVDKSADLDMATEIIVNAKTHRPGVCNAAETLLVHKDVAAQFLPQAAKALEECGVELRGCPETLKILPGIKAATEEDFRVEFLDLILAIKVMDSLEDAVEQITLYGTGHSEAIITKDYDASIFFQRSVDAAAVYVNASTRFTDGFMFGFGAEIGISTQKLHARGPMGLKELTSYKYVISGQGQIRK